MVEESKKVSEKKQEKENKEPVTSDNIKGSATDITSDVTSDATSDVIGNEQPIIHDRPTHRVRRGVTMEILYVSIAWHKKEH